MKYGRSTIYSNIWRRVFNIVFYVADNFYSIRQNCLLNKANRQNWQIFKWKILLSFSGNKKSLNLVTRFLSFLYISSVFHIHLVVTIIIQFALHNSITRCRVEWVMTVLNPQHPSIKYPCIWLSIQDMALLFEINL